MHDEKLGPLVLTEAMETNRVEELSDATERRELDAARMIVERRARVQRDNRALDRLAFGLAILLAVAFWIAVYATGGWRSVAGAISIILIAGTCLAMAHWLAQSWGRIVDVLSGR